MNDYKHGAQQAEALQSLIVAHRGASYDAPENTLAAFRLAWEQHADAIEGDFRMTRDGVVVCMHDETTQRTGDQKLVVAQNTLAALQAVDIGSWKAKKFAKERIATLKEVFAIVPAGKKIYIEVKTGVEIIPALLQSFKATSLSSEQIVVIAYDAEVIRAVKHNHPDIKAHLIVHFKQDALQYWQPTPQSVFTALKDIQADGLSTHCNIFINKAFVNELKSQGWEYHTWTVDEPEIAKHFLNLGSNSITTNRPSWLKRLVSKT